MIRIGSMPTCSQKSSSPPSTTVSPAARPPLRRPSSSVVFGLVVFVVFGSSSSASSSSVASTSSTRPASSSASSSSSSLRALRAPRPVRRRPWPTASSSTSGVLMISSIAREHVVPASPDDPRRSNSSVSGRPCRLKWSIPPDTVPRLGLPLKNFDTAASSHTDPMDDTIASAPASAVTDSSVGFSATSSSTTTRSNCLSSAGSKVVRVRRGQVLPRRVVDQIVVGVGAHECDQVGDGLEGVQVLVLAQERLPLVAGVAPAGRPHGVAVTVGQAQADGHEVSSHAAHNSDDGASCPAR